MQSHYTYHSWVSFMPFQSALCQISAACHPWRPQFLFRILTLLPSSSSPGRVAGADRVLTNFETLEGLVVFWNLGNGTGDLLGVCQLLLREIWDWKCLGWNFEPYFVVCWSLVVCCLLLFEIGRMPWKPPGTGILFISVRLSNLFISSLVGLFNLFGCGLACNDWFCSLLNLPISCLVGLMSLDCLCVGWVSTLGQLRVLGSGFGCMNLFVFMEFKIFSGIGSPSTYSFIPPLVRCSDSWPLLGTHLFSSLSL